MRHLSFPNTAEHAPQMHDLPRAIQRSLGSQSHAQHRQVLQATSSKSPRERQDGCACACVWLVLDSRTTHAEIGDAREAQSNADPLTLSCDQEFSSTSATRLDR